MKIASWNVNSLKVRLSQVLAWLEANEIDVLALQETKLADEHFPRAAFSEAGWHVLCNGQKTYNGVALISRHPLTDALYELPAADATADTDPQRRLLAATMDTIRIYNLYVPNGQAFGSEKFQYKLTWLARLERQLETERAAGRSIVVVGDFNIAPDARDVHDPEAWEGSVHCSEPERAALARIEALGFADSYRLFDQPEGRYSWWDYRGAAFRRNRGLRIDLILVSTDLVGRVRHATIDATPRRNERPSDHAPVIAELA